MSTHTAIIRTIDPATRLIHLALDDGVIARLVYRWAARLGFWLKPSWHIGITNTLLEDNLRDDTPRGVWGISDAGRKALKPQGK
jgi:hypothetical protein